MTEFKGTTGKWEACMDFDNNDRIIIYADSGIQPHICYTPDFTCEDEVMNANAQLIAAAPELLKALQTLLEESTIDHDFESFDSFSVGEKLALSAIEKATGSEAQND